MLILVVNLTVAVGSEGKVAELFRNLESETRKESGCIMYVVQQSRENPRHFLVYEQYKNEAALEEHRASSHFKKYATDGAFRFVEERQAEFFNPIT